MIYNDVSSIPEASRSIASKISLCISLSLLLPFQGTSESDKEELLLNHSTNYKNIPQVFRKGSCLAWSSPPTGRTLVVTHEDILGESFWTEHLNGLSCSDVLEGAGLRQVQPRATSTIDYEYRDKCLPETWLVLRLDGQCFHK